MKSRDEHMCRLIAMLRQRGPCSRPTLARTLDVNLPTMSHLTRDLLERGLITEAGYAKSDSGRRAALLTLRGEYAYAIGLELSLSAIRGVVTDLSGRIVDRETGTLEVPGQRQAILDILFQVATALQRRAEPLGPVGLGVAVAGLTDEREGISLELPNVTGWRDVRLAELLAQRTGIPVRVGNDVQAATLGEQRYGAGRGLQDFIYLHIRHGIAVGLVTHGRLYAGSTRNAGEFGHVVVERDGPVCYCGNSGCLESLAAPPAICEQARQAIAKGVRTRIGASHESRVTSDESVASQRTRDARPVRIDEVLRAATEGDRLASNLIERAAEHIGVTLAGVVNVLNPEVLIYGGLLAEPAHEHLREAITRAFRANVLTALRSVTEIRVSALAAEAAPVGGAALVFENLFANGAFLSGSKIEVQSST